MQVANPADTPATGGPDDPETGKPAVGLRQKTWELLRDIVPKDFKDKLKTDWKNVPAAQTHNNIDGNISFFYGTLWFLLKLKVAGADIRKGMPSEDHLKSAVERYNGSVTKEEYRDRVWKLYKEGVYEKGSQAKTVVPSKSGKDEN